MILKQANPQVEAVAENSGRPADASSADLSYHHHLSERDQQRVRKVELLISNLLRIGVVASLLIVVFGTTLSFMHHGRMISSHDELQTLTGLNASFPHRIGAIATGLGALNGQSYVMLGLLLLIATPVMRVAVSIFAFVYEHDRPFVVLTSIVLALLLIAFVLGRAGG